MQVANLNSGKWQAKSACIPIIKDEFNNLNLSKFYILDLGKPRTKTIEFFQQWPCYYRIFNLYDEVVKPYKDDFLDMQSYQQLLNLPHVYDYQLDLIIIWDLLSYMKRDNIIHLLDFLSMYSHEGTLLYMINPNQKFISKTPAHYSILSETEIQYSNFSNDKSHPSPRHTTKQLVDLMPSFNMYKLSMLQHNIIEHLCIFEQYRKPPRLGLIS